MLKHFLACFIKDCSPQFLYTTPIPSRNSPIANLIPPKAYAYFICDIDVVVEDDIFIPVSAPENCSHKTFLGGTIYNMDMAMEAYKDDEEMLEFLNSWEAEHIIVYDNAVFPFYEEDIQISINQQF